MPLEGVVGGSGRSWNRLSHYYGLYLDHCKLSSLLQSFRCGLHGQIKENFCGGVANYRYCQTNSPFLYTHCTTVWEKEDHNYFQTVLFYYDQLQQRSRHPSKSQNNKKLLLFSTPDWLLLAPGSQNLYPWCSGFSEFHRKLVWNFLKSNKGCNLNIFFVVVFKFVSFVFQGPQKHRSQLILLDRYM